MSNTSDPSQWPSNVFAKKSFEELAIFSSPSPHTDSKLRVGVRVPLPSHHSMVIFVTSDVPGVTADLCPAVLPFSRRDAHVDSLDFALRAAH